MPRERIVYWLAPDAGLVPLARLLNSGADEERDHGERGAAFLCTPYHENATGGDKRLCAARPGAVGAPVRPRLLHRFAARPSPAMTAMRNVTQLPDSRAIRDIGAICTPNIDHLCNPHRFFLTPPSPPTACYWRCGPSAARCQWFGAPRSDDSEAFAALCSTKGMPAGGLIARRHRHSRELAKLPAAPDHLRVSACICGKNFFLRRLRHEPLGYLRQCSGLAAYSAVGK
jgi:hypothetical protein